MFSKLSKLSFLSLWSALFLSGIAVANAAGMHGGGHGHSGAQEAHGHALSFGSPAKAEQADRTIHIIATDNRFDLSEINAKDGETIRLVIENRGQLLHEFNLGTPEMHREHQHQMTMMMTHGTLTPTGIKKSAMPMDHSKMGMPMAHDDPNSVLIEPGKTGELTWTFKAAQGLEFACNIPGHYQAGMMGKIDVQAP